MVNLEFPLEQHTPLLHFQHLQQGATLRASAVKPMLDRWLVGKVWNDDFNACKTCLVGYNPTGLEKLEEKFRNGYRALNYKMRIEPKGALVSEYIAAMDKNKMKPNAPMYFGYDSDVSPDENLKAVSCPEGLTLKIVVLGVSAQTLVDAIKENIAEFFMLHNFGVRSSKGYGSFTVRGEYPVGAQSSLFMVESTPKWRDMMEWIDTFYKTIRGGINLPHRDLYFKSLMFAYAKSMGMRWDKKTVKRNLLRDGESDQQADAHNNEDILTFGHESDDAFDFRDILGLSTDELWAFYGVKITKSSDGMGRFQSPLLFKPVRVNDDWKVYLFWKELPREIYTKEIEVSAKIDNAAKAGQKVKDGIRSNATHVVTLHVPESLTIGGYMDFLFGDDAVDPADYYMSGDARTRNLIVGIYRQLRENYRP